MRFTAVKSINGDEGLSECSRGDFMEFLINLIRPYEMAIEKPRSFTCADHKLELYSTPP